MALTAKERMAKYRQRIRDDPVAHEQYKAKERERNQRRREKGQFKTVKDMTKREHRATKKRWRRNNQERKKRLQAAKNMLTPPHSPVELDIQMENVRSSSIRRSLARKKSSAKTACYRANAKLKIKLRFQEKLTEKYKKRLNRLIEKADQKKKAKDKSYLLQKTLIQNIRQRYSRAKSLKEKRQISSLVGATILEKCGLRSFAQRVLHISRRHIKPETCRPPSMKGLQMKVKVHQYFERDDVSRVKPDKQATITRKGEKRQVRLLLDYLTNLLSEGNKISYSMFCRLRPFHVVKPTEKDRKTCLCKIHDNLQMKLNTAFATRMCKSKNIDDMIKSVVCDDGNKKCMYLECDQCKDKITEWDFGENQGTQVTWKTWRNKREVIEQSKDKSTKTASRTVKETEYGTKQHLSDYLNSEINRARRHIFNIRAQYKSLKFLREKLSHEEIMMHVDFSENYNCKYSNEIQSMHFGPSRRQISLHTGVVYVGKDVLPFCSMSDNLKHSPGAIWAYIQPVIGYIQEAYSQVEFQGIHFVSDGPTTQYRNKANFHLWANKVIQNKFKYSTWNFLEASHGKGAADGVGAAVKRKADNLINVKQSDITCAKDLCDYLSGSDARIRLFLVKDTHIDDIENEIPQDIAPIPNTMKLHQVMHRIGVNRYFWPMVEDRLWYREKDIICLIDEPHTVTARHRQINPKIWPLIEKELSP